MKDDNHDKNSVLRLTIKPSILEWALSRSGKSEKIKAQFTSLDNWINGKVKPTLNQLEKYAKATTTPLGYFFLEEPPEETLPIPSYRTIHDDVPNQQSTELLDTIYIMQQRQGFMKDYFKENLDHELEFVNSYKGDNAKILADNIRHLLELELNWAYKFSNWHLALRYLIDRCEKKYITVMINGVVGNNTHRKLNVSEFRGFVLVDKIAPLIFINGADAKSAQIFTLIHEIGHLIKGTSGVIEASPINDSANKIEKICNSATAELLCPEDLFNQEWQTHFQVSDTYEALSQLFKVSQLVIARRAFELKIINQNQFAIFYEKYKSQQITVSNSEGGNFYATSRMRLGDLFSRAIIYQTNVKKIQYTDAYRLTGLKGNTYQKYVNYFERRGE